MPVYKLSIKCDLENMKSLTAIPSNLWKFNISNGNTETRNGITVSTSDVYELDGSKGTANYVMKWDKSSPQSYIKVVTLKNVESSYYSADSGNYKAILAMECRGIEIISWIPGVDFDGESEGGFVFNSIDLSDKEWCEFDEDNDASVSVMNLEHKIERGK